MGATGRAVLVVSAHDDLTAKAITEELHRRSHPVERFDLGDFPAAVGFTAELRGGRWHLAGALDLERFGAIYYRRPTRFAFPDGLSAADRAFAAEEARLAVGGVLATFDGTWVNDPAKTAIAEYKPLQLSVAARIGLSVPHTLITNDHAAVAAFSEHNSHVVCKPLSSVAHRVDDSVRITYTTPIDGDDIDPAMVGATAHLFQERVDKQYEVRVTMVGRRPLGVAIHAHSAAARRDWRSDYASLTYAAAAVPAAVAERLCDYLDAFGLAFGAFDLVVTPEDEWVFLECNPSGQWLWLERETGVPITSALADLLTGKAT
ncbi:ATP-grasp ribosomal peptide maturase [Actinokineospora sp. NBRC 105648]|uniref:ATP-grasp ribosomal peptide maturase n=1 Tax=Actinokineospora sp. NBRC 105648 TaxID=3032206 RepID=UPI0024A317FC|nr:ATP-grasp ribosomal peptide maturase [Actinokineospora sp. NBRC 105648]GLZ41416.1 ATP-grasp ribosomal peptide maturase [Actinokineospora sp. NBRC 105648]